VKRVQQFTAVIEREGDGFVALCPELAIASQGNTVEEARHNLEEVLELFFEMASPTEIGTRLRSEVYVTRLEIMVRSRHRCRGVVAVSGDRQSLHGD
jgi:predicted RNase H-like HicB family nuclease